MICRCNQYLNHTWAQFKFHFFFTLPSKNDLPWKISFPDFANKPPLKSHQIWHQTSSFFFIIIADLHLTMTLLKIMITKFHLVIWYPKLDLKSLLIVSLHFLQWICNHITVITAIIVITAITNNILIHSYTINTCSHNSRDLLPWDLNFITMMLILKKINKRKIAYLFMKIFIIELIFRNYVISIFVSYFIWYQIENKATFIINSVHIQKMKQSNVDKDLVNSNNIHIITNFLIAIGLTKPLDAHLVRYFATFLQIAYK